LTASFRLLTFSFQAKVSLDRIATFFEEDEVTDQVSTLKRSNSGLPTLDGDDDNSGLGIENGSFKWNEIEEKDKKTPNSNGAVGSHSRMTVAPEVEDPDHNFELKDIDIKFPEGQLSLITGPTASGKTALLVSTMDLYVRNPVLILPLDGITRRDDTLARWTNHYGKEYFQGRRKWSYAGHLVRCPITVASSSIHQGQYPVWIPVRQR
jgi:ABC-type multidrug transport system fused ATPase/permease subunit